MESKEKDRKKEMVEKIKFAIFDMDGTLVDSLGYWDYFWEEFGKKYFPGQKLEKNEDIDRAIRTITMREASVLIRDKCLPGGSAEEIFELATGMLSEHYSTRVDVKGGTREFLNYLKSRGVKMCVASATVPAYIKTALERHGLYGYFEFSISCDEVGAGKEKPDVFLEALKRLGGNLAEACVFEDSFIALETAKKAGFMTVGIYDKNNYCQDRLAAASDFYVAEGSTLLDIPQ